jgi:probable rRNA maturation factor
MHDITVQYVTDRKLAPAKATLCLWARQALASQPKQKEITIRIVDVSEMTALNEHYRKKKGPTNVLSFPADLPESMQDSHALLGDIVICATVVIREAAEQHKTVEAHWAHMVVHGVLHLLGHDHEKDDEAEVMEALEINILQQLGFSNPYINEDNVKHHE